MLRLIRHLSLTAILVVFPFSAVSAMTSFQVNNAVSYLNDRVYLLNAVFDIELSNDLLGSIDDGFELPLVMEIEIFLDNTLWFDESLVLIRQQYRLRYHPLRYSYSLFNINSGTRVYYAEIEDVVNDLSVLIDYPVLDINPLPEDKAHYAKIRFGIDQNALPIPIRTSWLAQNRGTLISEWYQWEFGQ